MKQWFLVDDNGDLFEEKIGDVSREEARRVLEYKWSYLTESEKKKRAAFYAVYAEPWPDSPDCPDFDTSEECIYMKPYRGGGEND